MKHEEHALKKRGAGMHVELQRIESKLKESEKKYKTLFEQSPHSIILIDTETGKIIDFNSKMNETLGYTPEEFKKLIIPDFDITENSEEYKAHILKIIKKGHDSFETKYKTKNGKIKTIFVNANHIKVKEKNYILSFLQDKTDKIQTEEELRYREKLLSNTFKSIQDGILIIDKDYNIVRANPTIAKWYPHMKPILSKKCYNVFFNKLQPCEDCTCQEVIKKCKSSSNIIERRNRDGKIIGMLDVYTFPLLDHDTGEIKGVIEYIRDISERLKAQIQLRESEEKIKNIITNISDVLVESNIDGTIIYISHQIYDIIGYHPKELTGLNFSKLLHPQDKLGDMKLINNAPEAGDKFSLELRLLHKKGYYVPISVKGSLAEIDNKLKIFALISDITEKRKIEKMMKREIEKLKELEQIRSDLIRRISHELKTPLISIFSGSQYLLDKYKNQLNENFQYVLKFIHEGGYRLKNIVDNLLITYSIESNQLILNFKRENLIPIIKNCVDDLIFIANKRKIFINVELIKKLYLDVDKLKISNVISNILSNAIKNTYPNGSVYIKTFEHPRYVDIIIKDDGVGLTKREIQFLFKKFGKVERYGKNLNIDMEGPGLGLYISKEIVKLHNGKIIVKSKGRGKGSKFTIRLNRN
ncbi:MAG: PAS domain S-box protein [Promethearchaeota archaeon]